MRVAASASVECSRASFHSRRYQVPTNGSVVGARTKLACLSVPTRFRSDGSSVFAPRKCRRSLLVTSAKTGSTNLTDPSTRTERILREIETTYQDRGAKGAGSGATLEALRRADQAWSQLRSPAGAGPVPEVVQTTSDPLNAPTNVDVVVCGGTLGVFLAAALQKRGLSVAVVERGKVTGRDQEWNISRAELEELIAVGVLTSEQVEEAISVEFNPCRCGFAGGEDIYVENILNLGVSPRQVIEAARSTFLEAGGVLLEDTSLQGITVHPDCAAVEVSDSDGERTVAAKLVVDCMGNFSPVVRQIRQGQRPDGVCLVVGTCARGYSENKTGDVIFTERPMAGNRQIFWEAFPAGSGPTDRTTYMFTYVDADEKRSSLAEFLDEYWDVLPEYQNVDTDDLQFLRCLFGFFPTYRDSPLAPGFDRVVQVGDAGGLQSPLSFGGFGALSRHLSRLTAAVTDAVDSDCLDQASLRRINAYSPGLSSAWLFQKAMSVPADASSASPTLINEILDTNFQVMEKLGAAVLRPFLQDVVQFGPLAMAMAGMTVARPLLVPRIILATGVGPVADWTRHFLALGLYDLLYRISKPLAPLVEKIPDKQQRFYWRRLLEAWEYGSGNDYQH